MSERTELPTLPIVVSIEDEDVVAYDKERETERAESRNAPSEGFKSL